MMMRWLMCAVAALAVGVGCQPTVPSPLVPLPLPLEPMPTTKLTIVGTGDTAEQAREAAIDQLVRQVILPPSEPSQAPTPEFVRSLIRGYNIAGVAQDFLGKYYVTVELTISQLGINYQELYYSQELLKRELELAKQGSQNESEQLRLAREREQAARQRCDQQRAEYEKRLLDLTTEVEKLRKGVGKATNGAAPSGAAKKQP